MMVHFHLQQSITIGLTHFSTVGVGKPDAPPTSPNYKSHFNYDAVSGILNLQNMFVVTSRSVIQFIPKS